MRVERSRCARLCAMVTLVVAVAYFAAVYLGRCTRLRLLTQHILRSVKRIYGAPEFRFYAVCDRLGVGLGYSYRRTLTAQPDPRGSSRSEEAATACEVGSRARS